MRSTNDLLSPRDRDASRSLMSRLQETAPVDPPGSDDGTQPNATVYDLLVELNHTAQVMAKELEIIGLRIAP